MSRIEEVKSAPDRAPRDAGSARRRRYAAIASHFGLRGGEQTLSPLEKMRQYRRLAFLGETDP